MNIQSRGFSLIVVLLLVAVIIGIIAITYGSGGNALREVGVLPPTEKVVFSFTNTLEPSTDRMFEVPEAGSSKDPRPAQIVSRTGGLIELVPEANGFGGDIYSGSSRPVASPMGNYAAYIDHNIGSVMLADTTGNRIRVMDPAFAPAKASIHEGVHAWSPDERKLLFTTFIAEGCGMTAERCPDDPSPEGAPEGYQIADLNRGEVRVLTHVATSSSDRFYFEGWLDNETLLFTKGEGRDLIHEYRIGGFAPTPSTRFGISLSKIHHFAYIGTAADGAVVYTRSDSPNTSQKTTMELVIRKGTYDHVITTYAWGSIQDRDISISEDGRYITWSLEGELHIYDTLAEAGQE